VTPKAPPESTGVVQAPPIVETAHTKTPPKLEQRKQRVITKRPFMVASRRPPKNFFTTASTHADTTGMESVAGREVTPTPEPVVLLVDAPQEPLPSSSYQVEVTLANGDKSNVERFIERTPDGEPRAVTIAYRNSAL